MSCAPYLSRSMMKMEGGQIYYCKSSRIETNLCSHSRHCHSGYATDAFFLHCLAETPLTSMKIPRAFYPVTQLVLVFDRCNDLSAIDHERMRRAGEVSTNYNLTASSPLPNRDAILKNKHNKWELSRGLSSFNLGPDVTMDSRMMVQLHTTMLLKLQNLVTI